MPNRTRLLAFLLGAASVAGYAPLGWFPLVWLALGGLFLILREASTPRRAALTGFAFGLGAFLVGVSWVYVSLHQFGGLAAPLAAVAALLYCAVLALFPALAAALFVQWRPSRFWLAAGCFAGFWTLAEWLRGWVFTGFPWLAVGYSQTPPSPLAGFAPVLGVYGVSLLTALFGALLMEGGRRWLHGRRAAPRAAAGRQFDLLRPWLAAGLLLVTGAVLRGVQWTEPAGAPVSVALLQGNVEQDMKWRPERFIDSLQAYHALMRDHPARLTVLPETALPAFYEALPGEYLESLRNMAVARDGDVLLGAVTGDARSYTNSVVSLGRAPSQRYSKRHLVPFGEFVPPGFAWFMARLDIPMSGFAPGPAGQPPLAVAGQLVAMNICYEDVFGEELLAAASRATILANVSNTAWFGRSLAQPQHLQIARMRALETGRPMLRATNTGMTAVVSPDGHVAAVLAPFTRGALVAEVQGTSGLTPYVRLGNAGALALVFLLCAGALFGVRGPLPLPVLRKTR